MKAVERLARMRWWESDDGRVWSIGGRDFFALIFLRSGRWETKVHTAAGGTWSLVSPEFTSLAQAKRRARMVLRRLLAGVR